MVNQDLTPQPRSHADEVRAVPQIDRLAAGQPELGLVNQSRALQGVIRAFGLQVVVREPTQLLVDQNDQRGQSFFIVLPPVCKSSVT